MALAVAAVIGVWLGASPDTSALPQRPGRVPAVAAVRGDASRPPARAVDGTTARPMAASRVGAARSSRRLPHRHVVLRRRA